VGGVSLRPRAVRADIGQKLRKGGKWKKGRLRMHVSVSLRERITKGGEVKARRLNLRGKGGKRKR